MPEAYSSPLRDRFGATFHLNFYEESDIATILARSARLLKVEAHQQAIDLLSTRSRRTPRVANRLLKRVRDFAQVRGTGLVDEAAALAALKMLDVDHLGLDRMDRHLLSVIVEKFQGGPVGLGTLAAATQEETDTIEDVHEPYLIQLGFLERTPRGRMATEGAYRHLGRPVPEQRLV